MFNLEKKLIPIAMCAAAVLSAGEINPQYIPTVATVVTTNPVSLTHMSLVNISASAVTVTVTDRSTNCNGAACVLWKADLGALGSPANNATWNFDGVAAANGFTWQASASNAVVGSISFKP